ncbi:MAG: hypothetical protein LBB54_01395 [Cellulomonadaceae bacterium]|nr:hypothetical protein [Cellulomonadaceae bacterium]
MNARRASFVPAAGVSLAAVLAGHGGVGVEAGAPSNGPPNQPLQTSEVDTFSPVTGWYLPDGRGSIGQVTASGGLAYAATYDPWGTLSISVGASASPQQQASAPESSQASPLQLSGALSLEELAPSPPTQ